MKAVVEYTSHRGGNPIVDEIAGEDFAVVSSVHCIEVPNLVIADGRQKITITIYNADGSVYAEWQESIENYVANLNTTTNINAAIMKFADSAYAYLHRNDKS